MSPARSLRGSAPLLLAALCAAGAAAQVRVFESQALPKVSSAMPHLADIDGDGDLDVVGVGSDTRLPLFKQGVLVLVNDGDGHLVSESGKRHPGTLLLAIGPHSVVGDVDRDGDLDLIFTERLINISPQLYAPALLLNDGKGYFKDVTATHMPGIVWGAAGQGVLIDVERDGDLDLVVAAHPFCRILVNDGKGRFTDETVKRIGFVSGMSDVASGDIDGDGDVDLIFGSGAFKPPSNTNTFYLNDGKGVFTQSNVVLAPGTDTAGIALRDLDGDGDLDVFLASFLRDYLFLNDGKGRFTDVSKRLQKPAGYFGSSYVVLADIDGNGTTDIYVSPNGASNSHWRGWSLVWFNDGNARFTLRANFLPPLALGSQPPAFGDLDGDADPDIVVSYPYFWPNTPPTLRVWLSLKRHVRAQQPPRVGGSWNLDLYALANPSLLLPFAAAGRARIDVPGIGRIGLDPATTIALGAYRLARGKTEMALPLPLPNDRRLRGLPLSVQMLVFDLTRFRFDGVSNTLTQKIQ